MKYFLTFFQFFLMQKEYKRDSFLSQSFLSECDRNVIFDPRFIFLKGFFKEICQLFKSTLFLGPMYLFFMIFIKYFNFKIFSLKIKNLCIRGWIEVASDPKKAMIYFEKSLRFFCHFIALLLIFYLRESRCDEKRVLIFRFLMLFAAPSY